MVVCIKTNLFIVTFIAQIPYLAMLKNEVLCVPIPTTHYYLDLIIVANFLILLGIVQ